MFVSKFINGKNEGSSKLKKGIDYILNNEKTRDKYFSGFGLFVDSAFSDMMIVKDLYRKTEGRGFIHMVLSPSEKAGLKPELVHNISLDSMNFFFSRGYQVLVATHCNTPHTHSHAIINSVNAKTGLKFTQSRADMELFKKNISRVISDYNISQEILIDNIDADDNNVDFMELSIPEGCRLTNTQFFRGSSYDEIDEELAQLEYQCAMGKVGFNVTEQVFGSVTLPFSQYFNWGN